MKLCNETITVFNAHLDRVTRNDVFHGTVIRNVSWYSDVISNVGPSGLQAANRYTIRIPTDADFGGKTYVDPLTYAKTEDVEGLFTLGNGDVIVRGEVVIPTALPADLHKQNEAFTVLSVTDDRRALHAPHWKVVGK